MNFSPISEEVAVKLLAGLFGNTGEYAEQVKRFKQSGLRFIYGANYKIVEQNAGKVNTSWGRLAAAGCHVMWLFPQEGKSLPTMCIVNMPNHGLEVISKTPFGGKPVYNNEAIKKLENAIKARDKAYYDDVLMKEPEPVAEETIEVKIDDETVLDVEVDNDKPF